MASGIKTNTFEQLFDLSDEDKFGEVDFESNMIDMKLFNASLEVGQYYQNYTFTNQIT